METKDSYELYCDSAYYDMWCVRNVNDNRFQSPTSFHFIGIDRKKTTGSLAQWMNCEKIYKKYINTDINYVYLYCWIHKNHVMKIQTICI